jgi:hypothetical protein
VSYFPSAAAILLLFSNASYKERRRCKLFVSSESYVRTAPFSPSSLGRTRMYRIPKSSPGCCASSLTVILPPATLCTLLFPSPSKGYSRDIMFRPSHAQEFPFHWSLCVYTDFFVLFPQFSPVCGARRRNEAYNKRTWDFEYCNLVYTNLIAEGLTQIPT